MTTTDLHIVLGASGGIGSALVTELVRQDRSVRAVSRNRPAALPASVEFVAADLSDPAAARAAMTGAAVVFHAAQPEYTRWAKEFEPLTDAIADAAAATGATLVLADNLYMYGPCDGPLTEDTPMRPAGTKQRVRARMAERLLAREDLRVVLGRASDYFGPGGTGTALGDNLFAARGAVRWPGDPDQPHTVAYLPDVARALIALADEPTAAGRAWHLPAHTTTGREFLRLAGVRRVKATGRLSMALAGLFSPFLRSFAEVGYQWRRPFVSDASAFERAFGPFPLTPLADAVPATREWFAGR